MRKYISLLLALLLTSSVCATAANTKVVASGKIVSKEIKGIAGFKEIQTNSSVSVIYHNAADTRIVVSASDNVIPYIEVVKKGSRLEVGLKKNINVRVKNSRADLKVNVYAPEVSAFTVKGSGDIECKAVSGDVVALGVTGSGDVKVSSVATDELACGVSGSGDIVVAAGTVGSANYGVTGSGDIKASSVIATEANAVASGSGDISCRATKQLSTAAMGSGNIYYYGNPAKVIGKNKRVKARN